MGDLATEAAATSDKAEDFANVAPAAPHDVTTDLDLDPYRLEEAEYIKTSSKWTNKQRTLVMCSRGITATGRHLMDDLRRLMPHCKHVPKWEKKHVLSDINELAEMHSANNVIFVEDRKRKDLYLWLAKCPAGPTVKFQIMVLHTADDIKMAGNCLLHSRPLFSFDAAFEETPERRIIKELFIQALGTPRNHPKSKPFFDHVISLSILDNKIWFRHYQIQALTPEDADVALRQTLIEIGPRFVLNPIKILEGGFSGKPIWANLEYTSPSKLRGLRRKMAVEKAQKRDQTRKRQEEDIPKTFAIPELDHRNLIMPVSSKKIRQSA